MTYEWQLLLAVPKKLAFGAKKMVHLLSSLKQLKQLALLSSFRRTATFPIPTNVQIIKQSSHSEAGHPPNSTRLMYYMVYRTLQLDCIDLFTCC